MNSPASTTLASAPPCLAPAGLLASPTPELRESTLSRWFREEIEVHESDLRSYLKSRFSDLPDPDDILQDCYARLLKLRESGPLPITRAYLFVTVRNAALDRVRRRKLVPLDPLDQTDVSHVVEERRHAADQVCHDEELKLLEAAIQDLPPRCREVVVLCRLHRLSHRDIARRLGIAEATVHAQICLGLKKCRQFLCAHGVTQACLHVPDPE